MKTTLRDRSSCRIDSAVRLTMWVSDFRSLKSTTWRWWTRRSPVGTIESAGCAAWTPSGLSSWLESSFSGPHRLSFVRVSFSILNSLQLPRLGVLSPSFYLPVTSRITRRVFSPEDLLSHRGPLHSVEATTQGNETPAYLKHRPVHSAAPRLRRNRSRFPRDRCLRSSRRGRYDPLRPLPSNTFHPDKNSLRTSSAA